MAIKIAKPTNNARRQLSFTDCRDLDNNPRVKSLTVGKNRIAGRNKAGKLVVAHRGGGAKRLYRLVDFRQTAFLGQKATVISVEYDPNRSANIAMIQYETGEKSYIIASDGLAKGAEVLCDDKALIRLGNRMKIKNIPVSTQIHNVELVAGKGAQICRSAGSFATLVGVDEKYAQVKMPSGEIRKILAENFASIGIVSNADHSNIKIGKAGRVRHMGFRPTVRGKAKNPCDHPHGGGEGATSIGMPYPKTPWGQPALGRRTRNKKKKGASLILARRKK